MQLDSKLKQYRQDHLVSHLQKLSIAERAELEAQLSVIDFEQLQSLVAGKDAAPNWNELASRAEPPPAIRLNDPQPRFEPAAAWAAGEQALRDGRIAAIIVAGGQGTRLGFETSQGHVPNWPLSGRTLFQVLAIDCWRSWIATTFRSRCTS